MASVQKDLVVCLFRVRFFRKHLHSRSLLFGFTTDGTSPRKSEALLHFLGPNKSPPFQRHTSSERPSSASVQSLVLPKALTTAFLLESHCVSVTTPRILVEHSFFFASPHRYVFRTLLSPNGLCLAFVHCLVLRKILTIVFLLESQHFGGPTPRIPDELFTL